MGGHWRGIAGGMLEVAVIVTLSACNLGPSAVTASPSPGVAGTCPDALPSPPSFAPPAPPNGFPTHAHPTWDSPPCAGLAETAAVPYTAAVVAPDDRTIAVFFMGSPAPGCGDVERVEVHPEPDRIIVKLFLSFAGRTLPSSPDATSLNSCAGNRIFRTTWGMVPVAVAGRPVIDGAVK